MQAQGDEIAQSWQEFYRDKLVSIDESLQVIQPGQTIAIGMHGNILFSLCQALGERLADWPNLNIFGAEALLHFSFYQPEVAGQLDFTIAAMLANDDRAFTVLPFTAKDGR